MDLAGRLQLGSLRLKGLDLSAVDLQLALAGGQLTLKQFSAGVAGGQVTASGVLDARQLPARYQVHKRVQGSMCVLLQTLAQTDLLEGKGIWRSRHRAQDSPSRRCAAGCRAR